MMLAISFLFAVCLSQSVVVGAEVRNVIGKVLEDSYRTPKDYIQKVIPRQFPFDYYDTDPRGFLYHFTKFCSSGTTREDCQDLVSLVYFGNDATSLQRASKGGNPEYVGKDVVDTYRLRSAEDKLAVASHIHPLKSYMDPSNEHIATRHKVAVYYEDKTCMVITYDLNDVENRNYVASRRSYCSEDPDYRDNQYVRSQWQIENPQALRPSSTLNTVTSQVSDYSGEVLMVHYRFPTSYSSKVRDDCEWTFNPVHLHGEYTYRFEERCLPTNPRDCESVVHLTYTGLLVDTFKVTCDQHNSWYGHAVVKSVEIRQPTLINGYLLHHIVVRMANKECIYRQYTMRDVESWDGFWYDGSSQACPRDQWFPSATWAQNDPKCNDAKVVPKKQVSFVGVPSQPSAPAYTPPQYTAPPPPPKYQAQSNPPLERKPTLVGTYAPPMSASPPPPPQPTTRPTVMNEHTPLQYVPYGTKSVGVLAAGVQIPKDMKEANRYDHSYVQQDRRYSHVLSKYCRLAGVQDPAKPKLPIYDEKSCVFIVNLVFNEFVLDYFQVSDDLHPGQSYEAVQVIPRPTSPEVTEHKAIVHMSNGACFVRRYQLVELFKFVGQIRCSEDPDYLRLYS